MMFNICQKAVVLGAVAATSGCYANDALPDKQAARDAAVDLLGGEAEGVKRVRKHGSRMWEIELRMENGAELEVVLFSERAEVFEVFDGSGPFDYGPLSPLDEGLTYDDARAIAEEEVEGECVAWEVKFTDDGYFYEFYQQQVGGNLWEIKLWADSGEVFVVEAKDEVD